MKLVEVDERAAAEVLEAALWYEAREEGVGVRFIDAVEGAIEALTTRRLRPLEGASKSSTSANRGHIASSSSSGQTSSA